MKMSRVARASHLPTKVIGEKAVMTVVAFLLWNCDTRVSAVSTNRSLEDLLTWFKTGEDIAVRPNVTGGPVHVSVESFISSVGSIDEQSMDFSVDMYFRQRWREERFAYRPMPGKGSNTTQRLLIGPDVAKKIWRPDIFFVNSKKAEFHYVPTENILFGISPNGDVLLSSRITTTLACSMNFRKFPMDHQQCKFQLGSYAHTEDDVILNWRGKKGIILADDVEIPHYVLTQIVVKDRVGKYNTGTFSEPEAIFYLQRRLAYYVYGCYLPVTLVVLLSWVSFWIDPRSTPARVSLGVITILAMGNFLQSGKDTPQVSYATAMDVYVITCFVFVFLCLVEFAAVHCGLSDDDNNRKSEMFEPCVLTNMNKIDEDKLNSSVDIKVANGDVPAPRPRTASSRRISVFAGNSMSSMHYVKFDASKVEKYSRVLFPMSFAIFNIVYWTMYFS